MYYTTNFLQTPFYIFEGVDGSALFYTLHYIASSMGLEMECGSANVAAFSCLNGTYTATLPPACYLSNGTIKISVSASNKLGEGPTYTRSVGMIIDHPQLILTASCITCMTACV